MLEFLRGGFDNLQLDIVGFLAILGEASVLANAQVSTLSKFTYLPRLLPAPQALIRTSRPEKLAPTTGKVVGAHSGGIRDHVNHIAHILHNGDSLPAYSTRCVRITKDDTKAQVKARSTGPLTWLSILGCGMSIALVVLSVVEHDGMSLLATLLLSLLSTIIGIGSKWSLKLSKRKGVRLVPPGDVVIIYPHGAFLVVKCDEYIARELYWAPEECKYNVEILTYRVISLTGTLMLMFGVIFLANASLTLQLYIAGAYVILNAAYWVVAAFPKSWHWDLSSFKVERESYAGGENYDNYTESLWKAIAITQSIEWVKISRTAPVSKAWNEWLEKAAQVAEENPCKRDEKTGLLTFPHWDFQQALSEFINPDPAANNV